MLVLPIGQRSGQKQQDGGNTKNRHRQPNGGNGKNGKSGIAGQLLVLTIYNKVGAGANHG